MQTAQVTRPVLRYFGGKWVLAPWIISHFPPHKVYCEPFGGGANVLLRKAPSYCEVYNDLDGEIVNVFRVLRERGEALRKAIESTPFAREEYDLSYEPSDDAVEQARRSIVRSYFAISPTSLTGDNRPGFRSNSMANSTHIADTWLTYPDHVESFQERLRRVVIENKNAIELMGALDSPETLFFVDPPYVHSTRSAHRGYRHEMTNTEHEKLCEFLAGLSGMVVLCGYDNEIYNGLGWETRRQPAQTNGGGTKMEVLWLNEAAVSAQSQMSFL